MQNVINLNPENQNRILPFLGGNEILDHPLYSHHRYVINLHDLNENDAFIKYPELIRMLQEKVKIQREGTSNELIPYWRYRRPGIIQANYSKDRFLVKPFTSKYHTFSFIPSSTIVSTPHSIIVKDSYNWFAILQSSIHEIYARFFGSSLGDTLRYTPSDCFETFPFPEDWENNPILEQAGKTYYEYRAELMVKNNQGLTETYNRFHDPDEYDSDILKLRELHTAMDKAVLDAYGWGDISTECTFLLDYEEEEEEDNPKGRNKKKPWRYRWTEATHDEILAKLLDLNQTRYEAEILGGKVAEGKKKGNTKKAGKTRKQTTDNTPTITGFTEP